jgi:hypothetical protein
MKRILVRTLVALVACGMLASAGTALAGNGATNGTIQTRNNTDNKAWITIYDLGKTRHLDYGDLNAHSTRAWTNCCYAAGSYYHVRAEVQDGKGHTIYDTSIQISPRACTNETVQGNRSFPFGYALVTLRKGNGNYYWTRDDGSCP